MAEEGPPKTEVGNGDLDEIARELERDLELPEKPSEVSDDLELDAFAAEAERKMEKGEQERGGFAEVFAQMARARREEQEELARGRQLFYKRRRRNLRAGREEETPEIFADPLDKIFLERSVLEREKSEKLWRKIKHVPKGRELKLTPAKVKMIREILEIRQKLEELRLSLGVKRHFELITPEEAAETRVVIRDRAFKGFDTIESVFQKAEDVQKRKELSRLRKAERQNVSKYLEGSQGEAEDRNFLSDLDAIALEVEEILKKT